MAAFWRFVPLAFTMFGCSWTRFDEAATDTPVVLLTKPDSMKQGFGSTVASAQLDDDSRLIVGGASGKSAGAVFSLGINSARHRCKRNAASRRWAPCGCYLTRSPTWFRSMDGRHRR